MIKPKRELTDIFNDTNGILSIIYGNNYDNKSQYLQSIFQNKADNSQHVLKLREINWSANLSNTYDLFEALYYGFNLHGIHAKINTHNVKVQLDENPKIRKYLERRILNKTNLIHKNNKWQNKIIWNIKRKLTQFVNLFMTILIPIVTLLLPLSIPLLLVKDAISFYTGLVMVSMAGVAILIILTSVLLKKIYLKPDKKQIKKFIHYFNQYIKNHHVDEKINICFLIDEKNENHLYDLIRLISFFAYDKHGNLRESVKSKINFIALYNDNSYENAKRALPRIKSEIQELKIYKQDVDFISIYYWDKFNNSTYNLLINDYFWNYIFKTGIYEDLFRQQKGNDITWVGMRNKINKNDDLVEEINDYLFRLINKIFMWKKLATIKTTDVFSYFENLQNNINTLKPIIAYVDIIDLIKITYIQTFFDDLFYDVVSSFNHVTQDFDYILGYLLKNEFYTSFKQYYKDNIYLSNLDIEGIFSHKSIWKLTSSNILLLLINGELEVQRIVNEMKHGIVYNAKAEINYLERTWYALHKVTTNKPIAGLFFSSLTFDGQIMPLVSFYNLHNANTEADLYKNLDHLLDEIKQQFRVDFGFLTLHKKEQAYFLTWHDQKIDMTLNKHWMYDDVSYNGILENVYSAWYLLDNDNSSMQLIVTFMFKNIIYICMLLNRIINHTEHVKDKAEKLAYITKSILEMVDQFKTENIMINEQYIKVLFKIIKASEFEFNESYVIALFKYMHEIYLADITNTNDEVIPLNYICYNPLTKYYQVNNKLNTLNYTKQQIANVIIPHVLFYDTWDKQSGMIYHKKYTKSELETNYGDILNEIVKWK